MKMLPETIQNANATATARAHYASEPVIEHFADPFPFDEIEDDPSYFIIKIDSRGARVKTLVNRGLKNFGSGKKIVFTAQGRATCKAVNCVEIMKTYYKKPIHQITRINQIRTVETWYPVTQGLDPIRVTRSVPVIYILISQENIPSNQDGYQVYTHRDPKKVLYAQVMEDHDTKQDLMFTNLESLPSEESGTGNNESEPVPESVLEPVPESVLEPVPESVLEPVFEPVIEPVFEPVLEPVIEPEVEPEPEPLPLPASVIIELA